MLRRCERLVVAHPWWTVMAFAAIAGYARFAGSLGHPVPWIFGDEFIYIENARNLATEGTFAVREQPLFLSLVTSVLDAPGFALFGDTDSAYVWIKFVNAFVMASAALPAYGLARMVVSVRVAIAFAAAVLAWPAFAYVHVVMTEPAYLPALLLAVWLLARAVELPTLGRQCAAMGGVALCLGVRLQLLVLLVAVPVICLVAAVLGATRGTGWLRRIVAFWPLITFSVGLPLLGVAVQLIRGAPLRGLLGGYESNDAGRVDLVAMLPWLVRHVGVVVLAVALVPAAFAVAAIARFLRRGGSPAHAGVMSVALVVIPLLVVQVATYASVYSLRVVERNLFVVEPLLLLLALAGIATVGVSRIVTVGAAVALGVTVLALPVADLLRPPPYSDTFSLLAVMSFSDSLNVTPATFVRVAAVLGMIAAGVAVFVGRRRLLIAVLGTLLPILAWSSLEVTRTVHTFSSNVARVLQPKPFDWIDRAVGADAEVGLLWPSDEPPTWVWEHEIWNRSIRSVVAVDGPMPVLETKQGTFSKATGLFVPSTSADVPPEDLFVAPSRWRLDGTEVARGRAPAVDLTVWRARRPLRLKFQSTGIFPDRWTAKTTELFAYGCEGGRFRMQLWRGFDAGQTITVTASGAPVRTLLIANARPRRFAFAASPDPLTGTCTLRIDVPGAVTGDQAGGSGDPRVLGVHILSPSFDPTTKAR